MKNNDDFYFKDKDNGNHDYENDFNFVNNDNKIIFFKFYYFSYFLYTIFIIKQLKKNKIII